MVNKAQAYKALREGVDVVLKCTYFEREEKYVIKASYFGDHSRKVAFYHTIMCIKNDFKDISTFYGGNKSNCKFKFTLDK